MEEVDVPRLWKKHPGVMLFVVTLGIICILLLASLIYIDGVFDIFSTLMILVISVAVSVVSFAHAFIMFRLCVKTNKIVDTIIDNEVVKK